jgi:hypothetical protein
VREVYPDDVLGAYVSLAELLGSGNAPSGEDRAEVVSPMREASQSVGRRETWFR